MRLRLINHSPRLNARLEHARTRVAESGAEALLVFKPENLRYLTDFSGSDGALIIAPDKAVLAVDYRYEERAERESANVRVAGARNVRTAAVEILHEAGTVKIGFESNGLTYAEYERYEKALSALSNRPEFVPLGGIVESVRAIKDEGEISAIRKAAAIADRCMETVKETISPGVSEKDVKNSAIDFLQAAGAEGPSFDIIVASGANAAMPHATATDKKIEKGDFVLVDLGCVIDGYCSDITRTFCVGSADDTQKKMYRAAAEAHAEALEMSKAGAGAAEIDEVCRASLERGLEGARFLHSLGHGVGLEIHEAPYIGPGSTDSLEKGMVFTIEPGLYRSGFGGVRIEDMVLLSDTPELLTGYSRELIEL